MRQSKALKDSKMEGGNPAPEISSQVAQSAGDEAAASVENTETFLLNGGKGKSMRKNKGKSMRKSKGRSHSKTMRKSKGKSMRKYKKKGGFVSSEVATAGLLLAANTMLKKNSTKKQKK